MPLRCGPLARHIYPSLVLVQPRKTRPYITENLLTGRKELLKSNLYVGFKSVLHPKGGTLIFSAYVGSDPASTVHPQKISGISGTPKKYLKFKQPQKISQFCTITLKKTLNPQTSPIL